MNKIHDKGYKKLFSNKVIFRQLLETFVDETWIKDLDFDYYRPHSFQDTEQPNIVNYY